MKGGTLGRTQRPAQDDLRHRLFLPHRPHHARTPHRGPDRQNTPGAPHTFNLDFHAIPFRGHEPDLEKHWVPLRNRALPAVMAFVAQAAGRRIMCYATANVLRADADGMVPQFARYWKE